MKGLIHALVALLMLGVACGASAQQGIGATSIKTSSLQDNLYLLQGYGGNVLLSVGSDGALLVDDEYVALTGKLVAAIAAVTPSAR
jgi:hypothetical protein